MSKRLPELFLFDIFIATLKIDRVASAFQSAQQLKYDFMAWDSVIREFEVIGEGMKRLIENGYFTNEHRSVVDFRNVLIHEYFGIDEEEVWNVIHTRLGVLRQEIAEEISKIDDDLKIELIEAGIEENRHLDFIVEALNRLR